MFISPVLKQNIPESYKRNLRQFSPHALGLTLKALRKWNDFAKIKTYCMFIGYPRSGHSLLGQLINAHTNAVIAHERNALKDIKYGYNKYQLFTLLLNHDYKFEKNHNRSWTGYNYKIPNSAQGTYSDLKVIGDKKGGRSTLILANNPEVFEQLAKLTKGLKLRVIHHIRNPYDNISTIAQKADISLENAIDQYFSFVSKVNSHIKKFEKIPHAAVLNTHHEYLINKSDQTLKKITSFLDLSFSLKYYDSCNNVIFSKPNKGRNKIIWTNSLIKKVQNEIQKYSFLLMYNFEK